MGKSTINGHFYSYVKLPEGNLNSSTPRSAHSTGKIIRGLSGLKLQELQELQAGRITTQACFTNHWRAIRHIQKPPRNPM
jgi:hypothetical protein